MVSVYSFTGAAVITSTVFSLLLFLSIDDNPLMKTLFGTLAIVFEAGKFYAWYEFAERRAYRNFSGALTAFILYFVLAAISIGGSVGGISSATSKAQDTISIEKGKLASYDRQIDAIEKQIELNNLAGEKYIKMGLIATGVARIQAENSALRDEQIAIAAERDAIPPLAKGPVIGLIDSIASMFSVSGQIAQFSLVVFLSILLDLFAAFFVGVIGEEVRFRRFYRNNGIFGIAALQSNVVVGRIEHKFEPALASPVFDAESASVFDAESAPVYDAAPAPVSPVFEAESVMPQQNIESEHTYPPEHVETERDVAIHGEQDYRDDIGINGEPDYRDDIGMNGESDYRDDIGMNEKYSFSEQIENALLDKTVLCSKKSVAQHFNLTSDEVNIFFEDMLLRGVLSKKANHHYYLNAS